MRKEGVTKSDIRERIKHEVSAMSSAARLRADRKIFNRFFKKESVERAQRICIYVSRPDEVNTTRIIDRLWETGKTVIVPRVDGDHLTLHEITSVDDLTEGRFHILEPKDTCPVAHPSTVDLFVVPGVAFDKSGQRLGHGFGFFDRLLKTVTAPKLGLAYACQVIAEVPHTSYDVSVTALVTEKN